MWPTAGDIYVCTGETVPEDYTRRRLEARRQLQAETYGDDALTEDDAHCNPDYCSAHFVTDCLPRLKFCEHFPEVCLNECDDAYNTCYKECGGCFINMNETEMEELAQSWGVPTDEYSAETLEQINILICEYLLGLYWEKFSEWSDHPQCDVKPEFEPERGGRRVVVGQAAIVGG